MTIKEILTSATNTQDYSIKYVFDSNNITLLDSNYVKNYMLRKYGIMDFVFGDSVAEFNTSWSNYVAGVKSVYNNYWVTLFKKLYNLEGETTETWSGTKTNTRTNNLKDSSNIDTTNTVTDNTKSSTNTDIKNTRKEPTFDSNTLNTVDETSESGNKSNNYVENTGTTTTTNIANKNNNYVEKTGTITDVESYTNYTHTTTNTETDYLVFKNYLASSENTMLQLEKIIDDFVFDNCIFVE